MTEEQLTVNRNAIMLQEGNLDLEVLIPDINWDINFEDRIARQADITLQTTDEFQLDLDDPATDLISAHLMA
ncbi:hypothetical protein EDC04DRAFT_2914906 [Pisolithus marmoratus]|nr:hypothetical protein EDC04DRAFT_2914906 [Pisolithus marmoratus]